MIKLSLMIGGAGGQGINKAATIFGKMCVRMGLRVFINLEYPSIVRGGHGSAQIVVREDEILSHTEALDLLLALTGESIELYRKRVTGGGAIIYDSSITGFDAEEAGDVEMLPLPVADIVKNVEGDSKLTNSVGLGAVTGLLDMNFESLETVLREEFSKLKTKVVEQNIQSAYLAYRDIQNRKNRGNFKIPSNLRNIDATRRMLIDGNTAIAMGAIKAGLKFYAGYPMTPSSAIMHYLARVEKEFGIVTKHAEDEIAAVGMAIGASFAGVRAMTATSGGGFSLMVENLGLAGQCEIPLVIVDGQRPGPSTGMPTRTEQGDLRFVLSASQGEFPRIVLAPGDPEECFRLGFSAFNLAEKYQTPVIILMDKHLGESFWTLEPFAQDGMVIDRGYRLYQEEMDRAVDYKRYSLTESGISPMGRPGLRNGVFRTTGDEHDENGMITEEEDERTAMMDKRLRKLADFYTGGVSGVKLHGNPAAPTTLVGWGSTKGVILECMKLLKEKGDEANFLQIILLNPFPCEQVRKVLENAKRVVIIEQNATAQLCSLIAEKTGITIEKRILKYSGRQFMIDELLKKLEIMGS